MDIEEKIVKAIESIVEQIDALKKENTQDSVAKISSLANSSMELARTMEIVYHIHY